MTLNRFAYRGLFKLIMVLFQTVICILFLSYFIWKKGEIPSSISESYYVLKQKWMFSVWAILMGMFLVFQAQTSPLLFIAGGALCFTASAPMFREGELVENVHNIGAGAAIALALFGLNWKIALFIIIPILGILFLIIRKNKIFWLELASIASIILIEILNKQQTWN